ncbi:hypothetical protein D3C81_2326340 [compost metagenome]
MGQLLKQRFHVGNFFMGFEQLFVDHQQAVFVFVVFFEIALCIVRRAQQRIKRDGDFGLVLIIIID